MPDVVIETIDTHEHVAEVVLARNALNTISRDYVDELSAALDALARDDAIRAIVVASGAPKFFSAGWDLPSILELDRAGFLDFYRAFTDLTVKLAALPKPVVACLEGFTVAGGCILALACDWRIMTREDRRFGLSEVDLGVPMPLAAAVLARERTNGRCARDLLVLGELFDPPQALEAGCVDAIHDPGQVRVEARYLAARLASKPPGAAAAMKRVLQAGWMDDIERGRHADELAFTEAWYRPEAQELLRGAAAKLVPREE